MVYGCGELCSFSLHIYSLPMSLSDWQIKVNKSNSLLVIIYTDKSQSFNITLLNLC